MGTDIYLQHQIKSFLEALGFSYSSYLYCIFFVERREWHLQPSLSSVSAIYYNLTVKQFALKTVWVISYLQPSLYGQKFIICLLFHVCRDSMRNKKSVLTWLFLGINRIIESWVAYLKGRVCYFDGITECCWLCWLCFELGCIEHRAVGTECVWIFCCTWSQHYKQTQAFKPI